MKNKLTNAQASTFVGENDFECGVLEIDWRKRAFSIRGIGGHAGDLMAPTEVMRTLQRKCPPDRLRLAAVVWNENADGCQQLCFYDLDEFQSAVHSSLLTEEFDHGR